MRDIMGKSVYIAEKPSVAQEFAKALHVNFTRKDGYLEGGDHIVTWCVGHLVTMSYPEAYDMKFKKWSLATLPFIPETFKYEVIPGVQKQFNIVKGLLNRPDVERIYVCTDSGREGEYIYRLVAQMAGVKDKEQRIIISGDADCISNTELTLSREGYRSGNFNLIIESFRWLSGGEFPIDIRRPHCTDNKLSIGVKDIGTMKTIFIIIIPAILLLIGVGIWFFRRRN